MSNYRPADESRKIGETWERNFCVLASRHGKVFSPHQIGSPGKSASAYGPGPDGAGYDRYLLPDVTVWSAPGEHHEIKHKNQDFLGRYGLERYRLDALVRWANTTGQRVLYTIHDWQRAGAKNASQSVPNRLEDWFYADVETLSRECTYVKKRDTSLVNGTLRDDVCVWYWNAHRYFRPLAELWSPAAGKAVS